jgi:hypothetical protein
MWLIVCAALFFFIFFKSFWKALFWVAWLHFRLLMVLLMLTIPLGFLSGQQFYDEFGWTPLSLVFGRSLYRPRNVPKTSIYHRG